MINEGIVINKGIVMTNQANHINLINSLIHSVHSPANVHPPANITTVVTAPTPTADNPPVATGQLADLLSLMARLRVDCPWDIKQTNQSLIPYAIEEAYELAEAVQADLQDGGTDDEELKSELGDVLLQVVFHCQLYAEQGRFGMADVIQTLQQKLIRRHPHVFDADNLPDEAAVKQRWDSIKAQELADKLARGKAISQLDKVKAGSALMQAQALQHHASKLGFDWSDDDVGVFDAIDKLQEEIDELKALIKDRQRLNQEQCDNQQQAMNKQAMNKEMGDCFFALVNIARKLGLDAEIATLSCVHKFRSRFAYIEQELAKIGKTPENSTLSDMDILWEQAKDLESP